MKILNTPMELENLYINNNHALGFMSIIAIHNTKNGPALGGCRYVQYSSVDDAIQDATNLAKAMTYKSAMAGLPLGGGKAVILSYAKTPDRTKLLHAFGDFVNELNGRYITASDSGTTENDMKIVSQRTNHVTSISNFDGVYDDTADMTATGVLRAIEAAVCYKIGKTNLNGIRVAIQGLGSVGFLLAKKLKDKGAQLIITDIKQKISEEYAKYFQAISVTPEKITEVECDIFSPCALGGVINSSVAANLNASIICGAANNQLANNEIGAQLLERKILYVPDYIANAGGVICAAAQAGIISKQQLLEKIENIYNSVMQICELSAQEILPAHSVANRLAEERFSIS